MTTWRKSSKSAGSGECVEIASTLGAVRDSKNPAGPTLPGPVPALVAAIRRGTLS
ncbi:DUF397 domain-containing protein [Actinokineospora sp. 24-640]